MRQTHEVTLANARVLREKWLAKPSSFCPDVLGFECWDHPTRDSQRKVFDAIRPGARISVRSSHKVGKSRTAAGVALYCGVMFPGCRVVMTAPTYRQVDEVLWREVRALHGGARMPIGGRPALVPSGGLDLPNTAQVLGFTTDNPVSFAGISAPLVVYLPDEASGIDERIFEAIDGNSAGGSIIMMTGNPTQLTGRFHASHHSQRHIWQTFHIDAETVIEATAGKAIPGLATRAWEREMAELYGVDSPAYDVRVKGDFPRQGSTAVIPMVLVDKAKSLWAATSIPDEPLVIGLDVARFGDDESVAQARRGNYTYMPRAFRNMDGPDLAAAVATYARELYRPGDRVKPRVHVDVIGVGASAYDALRRIPGLDVVAVNVSNNANDEERYKGLRSEMWFSIASFLHDGGTLPPDEMLAGELLAPSYKFDPRGRYIVESKDVTKATLRRSPDRADALALCVSRPVTAGTSPIHIPHL